MVKINIKINCKVSHILDINEKLSIIGILPKIFEIKRIKYDLLKTFNIFHIFNLLKDKFFFFEEAIPS